ncbi:hypothetical protein NDU88_012717 [Pleurodeles waltl]|uniref:Glycosyltransferase family 92 protein n=2 Tax=Pleurodeles waltl TaxID=8319 RepID=A0AAV7R584_PLEWA|nr:hypothetical protein NDU88_012717 [Pleurodeles waltl]
MVLITVYSLNINTAKSKYLAPKGIKTDNSSSSHATELKNKERDSYTGEISEGSITPLKNRRTFIVGAYRDDRETPRIRVIVIAHRQEVKDLYCWLHCRSRRGYLSIKKATMDIHTDRFGFPYGPADVLCAEPPNCNPKYMSLNWWPEGDSDQLPVFEIKNRKAQTVSANFTVCISNLFGNYNNILQVVQSIEMYKLLGAQKVMIYRTNCSASLDEILQYYTAEGTVEVVPWPIHEYLNTTKAWKYSKDPKDIGYYGQTVTLNDCIYRNMYRSKYVILNDLDEILLPYKHEDWHSMMVHLQKQNPEAGIFLFENHIFPKTKFTSTDLFNTSSWKAVPGEDILQHVHREPDRATFFNARKMILNPRKVIQSSVHSVLKAYSKSFRVPKEVAIVSHWRDPLQAALPKASLIKDTTIWRFNHSLIRNVNKVLTKTKQIAVT